MRWALDLQMYDFAIYYKKGTKMQHVDFLSRMYDRPLPKISRKAPLGLSQSTPIFRPFQRIIVDTIGPLPRTRRGNAYVIVFIDAFTKWPEAFPVPAQDGKTMARLLIEEIIARYSCPEEVLSDGGKYFNSNKMMAIYASLGINKITGAPYHPATQGAVERLNATIYELVSHYTNNYQLDWELLIPLAMFAYRTAKHKTTGYSPFVLNFGRQALVPIDIAWNLTQAPESSMDQYTEHRAVNLQKAFSEAQLRIRLAAEQSKERSDQDRTVSHFNTGQLVMRRCHTRPGKFDARRDGPYRIQKEVRANTYELAC